MSVLASQSPQSPQDCLSPNQDFFRDLAPKAQGPCAPGHCQGLCRFFSQLPLVVLVLCWTALPFQATIWGQGLPPKTDPTGRFGQPPPITENLPEATSPYEVLPPLELEEPLQPESSLLKVVVQEIRVSGSTVFSPAQLTAVVAPFVNRELTTEDLEELRRNITLLYIDLGYVSSGAIIPDQDVSDGILTVVVVESSLTDIQIEGINWFWPWYFSSRLNLSAGPPVNLNNLRDRLQLFLQDPRIDRMTAELKPGTQPGEGILEVNVKEASPWKAWLEFNNYQSPTVGAPRGLATGDPLRAAYRAGRVGESDGGSVRCVPVEAPFEDVPVHVVESPRVWG